MPIVTRNDPLSGVESKVFSGERLSLADGLALLESPDLMRIGHLADRERKRIVGDSVYFNCNRHINYTNICRNRCDFCAFSRDVGEEGAFTLRPEEILEKASEALDYGVTELHIVGGEHPDLPYEEVRRMIVDLHAFAPGVHLKAFTVSEMAHFAASTGMGEEEVLLDLKEAGLGSLPGGGAEIFAERVRSQVCSRKISGERWLEIHLSLIHISEPTRLRRISYAVFCLKKKKNKKLTNQRFSTEYRLNRGTAVKAQHE